MYGVTSNELPLTIEDESSLIASEEDLKSNKQQKLRIKNTQNISHLLYCFFGLQISFLTWGILQEKIMTQNYSVHNSFIDNYSNQITENLLSIISTGKIIRLHLQIHLLIVFDFRSGESEHDNYKISKCSIFSTY